MAEGPDSSPVPPLTAGSPTVAAEAMRRFVFRCSIEIVPRGADPAGPVTRHVAAGTEVYVACVPGEALARIVAVSVRLHRAGFVPVPHLTARGMPDRAVLEDHLKRLTGEAGVDRLLLLGGDIPDARVGAFASSLAVLRTGLLPRLGIRSVGFATYPEAHPIVAAALLDTELREKLATAAAQGLGQWLVSQFCFEPEITLRHVRSLRADGIAAPLHAGISGPASWAAMAKFALICGFLNSARALSRSPARFGRLLTGFDPTPMLTQLAENAAAEPGLGLAGPHVFSFGGPERTAEFVRSLTARFA